jgi:repressor of nif and glnA expression
MDWLQQSRDIAERHAHRLKIVERAILIVVICRVVADLILLARGKMADRGRPCERWP